MNFFQVVVSSLKNYKVSTIDPDPVELTGYVKSGYVKSGYLKTQE